MKKTLGLALLAGWLTTGLYADEPTAKPEAAASESPTNESVRDRLKERILKQFDANGNGKLDDDEKEKMLAERAKRKTQDNPDNKDAAGNARGKAGDAIRQRILKMFDKDGDGKLNAEERAAAESAREEMGKGGKRGEAGREAMLKAFDKDGDGKLNDEERDAAKKAFQDRADKKGNAAKAKKKRED